MEREKTAQFHHSTSAKEWKKEIDNKQNKKIIRKRFTSIRFHFAFSIENADRILVRKTQKCNYNK